MSFAEYQIDDQPALFKCAYSGEVGYREDMTPAHIFRVRYRKLRCDPKNILPMKWKWHLIFDSLSYDDKKKWIEDNLPNRWEYLKSRI